MDDSPIRIQTIKSMRRTQDSHCMSLSLRLDVHPPTARSGVAIVLQVGSATLWGQLPWLNSQSNPSCTSKQPIFSDVCKVHCDCFLWMNHLSQAVNGTSPAMLDPAIMGAASYVTMKLTATRRAPLVLNQLSYLRAPPCSINHSWQTSIPTSIHSSTIHRHRDSISSVGTAA